MTINRVGSTDPINKPNKTNKAQQNVQPNSKESISVSKSAIDRSELIKTANIVNNTPDIRMDKVEEIKAKLQDPNYINDKVINSVAEKIMEDFGI